MKDAAVASKIRRLHGDWGWIGRLTFGVIVLFGIAGNRRASGIKTLGTPSVPSRTGWMCDATKGWWRRIDGGKKIVTTTLPLAEGRLRVTGCSSGFFGSIVAGPLLPDHGPETVLLRSGQGIIVDVLPTLVAFAGRGPYALPALFIDFTASMWCISKPVVVGKNDFHGIERSREAPVEPDPGSSHGSTCVGKTAPVAPVGAIRRDKNAVFIVRILRVRIIGGIGDIGSAVCGPVIKAQIVSIDLCGVPWPDKAAGLAVGI